ncbi:MAG: folylpolyglutamate synthase/dihydrofolate synthase family protein [Nitrospirota bacterium]
MSYSEAINYLYNLQKYGIKLGLDNIIRLMSVLENPHESFPSVHVAGTNGKGSTSAIIASVLKAAGLRVGLFTSPHLVSFTERIRVNGEEITEEEVISLTEEIREKISNFEFQYSNPPSPPLAKGSKGGFKPTFFEFVTAMAFLYFQRRKIDIAVIEVGMGGRLDATNIIVPEVSVITDISYDHREFLGDTLIEIANEKACIIKDGIPVVISSQFPEVLEVIEAKAEEKNTKVYLYGRDFSSVLKKEDISGIYFDYWGGDLFTIHDLPRSCAQGRGLHLPLIGAHQMQNASVAIKAIELINERRQIPPCPPLLKGGMGGLKTLHSSLFFLHSIREGLKNVKWPGRLEIINEEPPILIDGAHNPAAAVALSNALVKNFLGRYKSIILVLGIMGDKDIKGIMKPLLPLASEIILTSPGYERAASPAKLADIAAALGFSDVRVALTVKDAIEMAIKIGQHSAVSTQQSNPPLPPFNSPLSKGGYRGVKGGCWGINNSSLILVTGSFYTIGEAKEALGQKGVLGRLRE